MLGFGRESAIPKGAFRDAPNVQWCNGDVRARREGKNWFRGEASLSSVSPFDSAEQWCLGAGSTRSAAASPAPVCIGGLQVLVASAPRHTNW